MNSTKVGVVGHKNAMELAPRLALGHRFEQVVLDRPDASVTHVKMALERKRRDVVLVLCDQVDRQKPFDQRKSRAVKRGAQTRCQMRSAARALKVLSPIDHKRRLGCDEPMSWSNSEELTRLVLSLVSE